MKEVNVVMGSDKHLHFENRCWVVEGSLQLDLGITGPGTLKVEFVPDKQWPPEPGCEEWRDYWFEGEGKMIRYLLEDGVSRARMVCGMSAAAWWYWSGHKHSSDRHLTNAKNWMAWARGRDWRAQEPKKTGSAPTGHFMQM